MKEKLKQLMEKLEGSRYAPLVQFVKFGLVGVSSTLISYGVEMLCYYVLFRDTDFSGTARAMEGLGLALSPDQVRVGVTTLLAFAVSVTNAYYWNSRYTFRAEGRQSFAQKAAAYAKSVGSYALTGLVLSPAIKMFLVGRAVPFYLASLLSLLVTIPINFVMNKFWAFRKKDGQGKTE